MTERAAQDDRDYLPVIPYNGTGPQGGDPLEMDLNIWYNVSCHACNSMWVGGPVERPQADSLRPQAR